MFSSKSLACCILALGPIAFSSIIYAQEDSCTSSVTSRIGVRHKEPNGIGYNQGYSTLEIFGAPRYLTGVNVLPFIDARLHLFNDGRPAVNAGIGARYLKGNHVWGINSYYDYRKTSHYHYNQYSLGLEMLGKRFDVRAAGYLPLGHKESKYYHTKFSHFAGNNAFLSQRREFAMKGINAEVGYHIADRKNTSFYTAVGPYYFEGKGKNAIGGMGRVNASFFSHFKVELSGSYDPVFKWIGQGEAGLFVSFGPKIKPKKKNSAKSTGCDVLAQRLIQPVDRHEIIVLDRYKKISKAIDPITNDPYFFIFVNNQSHSLGTYESPYPSIIDAENASSPGDILYVYPGSGAPYDVGDAGVLGLVLQENQKLFGSAIAQSLMTTQGNLTIPQQSAQYPYLKGVAQPVDGIVTLANSNEVSGIGFESESSGSGVLGGVNDGSSPIENAYIHDNIFSGTFTIGGVVIAGTGEVMINRNMFDMVGDSAIKHVLQKGSCNLQIISNVIDQSLQNISPSPAGVLVLPQGSSSVAAQIHSNRINILDGPNSGILCGMYLYAKESSSSLDLAVSDNNINIAASTPGAFAQGIFAGIKANAIMNAVINNNTISCVITGVTGTVAYAKGIGSDNYSSKNSSLNIFGNKIYSYIDGIVGTDTNNYSMTAARIKNYATSGVFAVDIASNDVTVIAPNAVNSIYGIECDNFYTGTLSGQVVINKGLVQGDKPVGVYISGSMTEENNQIRTENP